MSELKQKFRTHPNAQGKLKQNIFVNEELKFETEGSNPQSYSKVIVYISDIWHENFKYDDAQILHLRIFQY